MGNTSSRARPYGYKDADAYYDENDGYENTAGRSWYKPKRSRSLGDPRGWFSSAKFGKGYSYTPSAVSGQYAPYPGQAMYNPQYPYAPVMTPQMPYPPMSVQSSAAPVIPSMPASSAAHARTPVIPQRHYPQGGGRTPMPEPVIPEFAQNQDISSPVIPHLRGNAGSESPVIPPRRGAATPHPRARRRPRSQSTPVFPEAVIPGEPSMSIPEPQLSQGRRTPAGFPEPQMRMTTPVTFPEPERAPPQYPPAPPSSVRPPSRLAPGQYGPYDRRHRRSQTMSWVSVLANPLPEPPEDLFESPRYRALVDELRRPLPLGDGALRRNFTAPPASASGRFYTGGDYGSGASREKKRRGLFGSLRFGSRRDREDGEGIMQMPVYATAPVMQQLPDGGTAYVYNPPVMAPGIPNANGTVPVMPGVVMPGPGGLSPGAARGPSPGPPRSTTPSSLRAGSIRMSPTNDYAALLHFSPHQVRYGDLRYPTAFHLLEAFKFLEHRPDIAGEISARRTFEEVQDVVAAHGQTVRQDWEQVAPQMMEEALYHKFKQHPNLQGMLLNTGVADLIYAEANDPFWGDGPLGQGANELGKALMRVRDRLRIEGSIR
ncbi:DUF1768-domain-containing protein [Obba rivulosa]|uniref:DUF1768-domain-containing protein n=1 Tax=Obba rivulosa TaxID=1052685 RepID=A0A8E2DRJ3_9APHY|nr:DUF1768-domain-containing protein [Obba rivulosa]